jgi:predicted metal-dependent hydrolase
MFDLDKHSILLYIIIAFVIFMGLKIYSESDAFNLKCIISDVDGERYCVRERASMELAANLLANVTQRLKDLVAYCVKKFPNDENIQRMVQKFNPTKISETLPTSEYTAYSENKGEKLAFCLNKKKNETKLIDINTLTFVAIHELAHIMTTSEGHKQEFWQNFKFLLEQAKAANIYEPVDYKKNPEPYCGMDISDNPYYDLK